jgi:NADPH:quinone reductase
MSRTVFFDTTGGPEVLQLADEPPADPAQDEVRVRLQAAGLNRLDAMMRSGASPRPVRLPHARLGCEGTGVVEAIGADVDTVAVGDAVIITAVPDMDVRGTYADHTVLPADRVMARPAGLEPVAAAALWVAYSTAYGALVEKAAMRPGDTVLITAASSSVGLAAIQIANQIGAVPLAVTRHTEKKAALLAAGAARVIVSDEESVSDAARNHTAGLGVDIIIDPVMGPGLAELATAARPGGTLLTVGWLDPRPATMPRNAPLTIYRYMSFEHVLDPAVVRRIAAFLTAGLRTGALQPTVARVFPLDEVVAAHEALEAGEHLGKIVLTIDEVDAPA